jgi:hypothetical protein
VQAPSSPSADLTKPEVQPLLQPDGQQQQQQPVDHKGAKQHNHADREAEEKVEGLKEDNDQKTEHQILQEERLLQMEQEEEATGVEVAPPAKQDPPHDYWQHNKQQQQEAIKIPVPQVPQAANSSTSVRLQIDPDVSNASNTSYDSSKQFSKPHTLHSTGAQGMPGEPGEREKLGSPHPQQLRHQQQTPMTGNAADPADHGAPPVSQPTTQPQPNTSGSAAESQGANSTEVAAPARPGIGSTATSGAESEDSKVAPRTSSNSSSDGNGHGGNLTVNTDQSNQATVSHGTASALNSSDIDSTSNKSEMPLVSFDAVVGSQDASPQSASSLGEDSNEETSRDETPHNNLRDHILNSSSSSSQVSEADDFIQLGDMDEDYDASFAYTAEQLAATLPDFMAEVGIDDIFSPRGTSDEIGDSSNQWTAALRAATLSAAGARYGRMGAH